MQPAEGAKSRHARFSERVLEFLVRALVSGPDSPRAGDPPSLMARLLPWWLRLLVVASAFAVARIWADAGVVQQLAWGLDYSALVSLSLAASYALWIFAINLALALLWRLVPLRPPTQAPDLWRLHHVITFLNRQVGHIEALATWLVISAVLAPELDVQLPAAAAVLLLGPPVLNGLARTRLGCRGVSKADGELNWARRPILYAFTTAGLLFLSLRAPQQIGKLTPIIAAVILGGVIPRYLRHRRRKRVMRGEEASALDLRRDYRKVQMGWPRQLDALFTGGVVLALLAIVAFAAQRRHAYDEAQRAALAPGGREPMDVCARDLGGPTVAEVTLFIASDSQLHELQGQRFPGQAEMADAFVPVALRPVELDVLAAATLWRFGSVFRDLVARATPERPLLWAHLGDFSDLGCQGELLRMDRLFDHFSTSGRLAGVAPGNHDKSFAGNFFWSPFWDTACRQRLEKNDSDALLRAMLTGGATGPTRLVDGATMQAVPSALAFASRITHRGSALVTVSPLGEITHKGAKRGLVGIFLDTADEIGFDLGIAGLFGALSKAQVRTVLALIHDLEAKQRGPYLDPAYLIFLHHPFDELTSAGHRHLAELVERLDAGADPSVSTLPTSEAEEETVRDRPPRVLALVAAHTHRAQAARHCIGHRRWLREVVVGSTIDPPQEAALLTVGPDESGRASMHLRTLPAVGREGRTCGEEPTVSAGDCQRLMAELELEPECKPLFRPERHRLSADCQQLERPMTLGQRLRSIVTSQRPITPRGIKDAQIRNVRHLFSCLCRRGLCSPSRAVVDLEDDRAQTDFLLDLVQHGTASRTAAAWERELTCLSWAAAAVQAHKAGGMEMADGLRCAFDDPTLPAAKDYVATLTMEACR